VQFKVHGGDFGSGVGSLHGSRLTVPRHDGRGTKVIDTSDVASVEVASEERLKKLSGTIGWGRLAHWRWDLSECLLDYWSAGGRQKPHSSYTRDMGKRLSRQETRGSLSLSQLLPWQAPSHLKRRSEPILPPWARAMTHSRPRNRPTAWQKRARLGVGPYVLSLKAGFKDLRSMCAKMALEGWPLL